MASSSNDDIHTPSTHSQEDEEDQRDDSRGRRKRRASGSPSGPTPKKPRYDDDSDYCELFNEMFEFDKVQETVEYEPSQIGCVKWSGIEKARFFQALDRNGMDNLGAISNAIGSKSKVEVHAYLHLLQRCSLRMPVQSDDDFVDITSVPAAIEISKECEEALDDAAEDLAAHETAWEEAAEQQEHGELWRLDRTTDLLILRKEQLAGQGQHEVQESKNDLIDGAAEMLCLRNMMELSRLIFMNSRDPQYNYRTYAEASETPSIRLTALLDLYNLVVVITRRIVAVTRFMALSRIQSMEDGGGYPMRRRVEKPDVDAALKSLNMERHNKLFLAKAIQRCNVGIHKHSINALYKVHEEIPYEQLEEYLIKRKKREHQNDVNESKYGDMSEADSISGGSSISNDIEDWSGRDDLPVERYQDETTDDEEIETEMDILMDQYLEQIDGRESRMEERLLWETLKGEDYDHGIREVAVPPKPILNMTSNKSSNWRSTVRYQTSWEQFDVPVPSKKFAGNQYRSHLKESVELKASEMESEGSSIRQSDTPDTNSSDRESGVGGIEDHEDDEDIDSESGLNSQSSENADDDGDCGSDSEARVVDRDSSGSASGSE